MADFTYPTAIASGFLIADPTTLGYIPAPTMVNNVPVAACLELQSTEGAFLMPRVTDSEMNDISPAIDGMQVYNITHTAVYARAGGAWAPIGSAGAGTVTSITQGSNIVLSPSTISTTGSVSLNPVLTGLTSAAIGNVSISNSNITANSSNLTMGSTAAIGVLNLISGGNILVAPDVNNGGGTFGIQGGARLALYNTASTRFISLAADPTLAASASYTLPTTLPSVNGQVLASTTLGVMSWVNPTTASISITAGSNLSATPNPITGTGTISLSNTVSGLTSLSSAAVSVGNLTISTSGSNSLISSTNPGLTINSDSGSGSIAISAAITSFAGIARLMSGNPLVFNGSASGSISISAPSAPTISSYTLPSAPPVSNGQLLSCTTGGAMSWVTSGGGTVTSITAGSNLSGGTITGSGTIALNSTLTGLTSVAVGSMTIADQDASNSKILTTLPTLLLVAGTAVSTANMNVTSSLKVFNGANSVGFTAPGTLTTHSYTLPQAAPASNGQVLSSTTAGVMSWVTPGTGTVTSITATSPNLTGGVITGSGSIGLNTTLTGLVATTVGGWLSNSSGIAGDGTTTNFNLVAPNGGISLAPSTTVLSLADFEIISNGTTRRALKVWGNSNGNFFSIKAPATFPGGDTPYVWPNAYPSVSGYHLSSDTSGNLSWTAATGPSASAKFLLQVADGSMPNAQAMGALATGLVKNTTTTGVQSIAVAGTDYYAPDATYALKINNVGGTPNANVFIATTSNGPTTPVGGGILYVQGGALRYIGSNGTITVLAPA